MRTIGQLYQIVLDHFDDKESWDHVGICSKIGYCGQRSFITPNEFRRLRPHFFKQRPTIFSKFWWSWSYKVFTETRQQFWWRNNKAGEQQRKLFLAYLAKKYRGINIDGTINHTIP